MAAMTLAEARLRVREHLDDPNSRRWTTAQVDSALRACLSACQHAYNTNGGSRFVVEQSVTTSATTGAVSLASVLPIRVTGVVLIQGNIRQRLKAIRRRDRELQDLVARTLTVETVTEYALSATSTDPLVGIGAAAANTWPAFDEWVCLEAAMLADVKDNEKRGGLERMAPTFRANVMQDVDPPRTRQWPTEAMLFFDWLRWSWTPATQVLTLHQAWV